MADNTLEAILRKRTGVITVKYEDFHLNYDSYLRLPVCLMHPRPGPPRLSPGGSRYRWGGWSHPSMCLHPKLCWYPLSVQVSCLLLFYRQSQTFAIFFWWHFRRGDRCCSQDTMFNQQSGKRQGDSHWAKTWRRAVQTKENSSVSAASALTVPTSHSPCSVLGQILQIPAHM